MQENVLILKFHQTLFPIVQITMMIHSIDSDNGLTPNRLQAITWNKYGL